MAQTSVGKVNVANSKLGSQGQRFLATGTSVGMRLWENEPPAEPKSTTRRDYETVGYVLCGRAELTVEDQIFKLEPGDSWVVPRGAAHRYTILEDFTAIEATAPPSEEQP